MLIEEPPKVGIILVSNFVFLQFNEGTDVYVLISFMTQRIFVIFKNVRKISVFTMLKYEISIFS